MPRRDDNANGGEWSDASEDDAEDWAEDWTDGPDDESETVPCPRCGADVYEDAPYCPHCDADLTDGADEGRQQRKPWWIIVGSLACMYAFYRWILMR